MTTNLVKKLDSNVVGLRFCEEISIGLLGSASTQVWYPLEPNSFNEFGAPTKTVARMPINPSRQLRKGVLTDLDPAAGFANDLTQDGLTRLLQGFFFASLREDFDTGSYNHPQSAVSLVVNASHKYELAFGDTDDDSDGVADLVANDLLKVSGCAKSANNGLKVVSSETSAAAGGVLTSTDVYSDGETVTIGTRVYTFKTALTPADGEVLVGSESVSIANLAHAINGTGGVAGTDYYVTAADPNVTAVAASHTLTVTAKRKGYGPNAYATTEACANASWGAVTLTGGTADIVVTDVTVQDETPPAAARIERVGHQGASADLTITNNGTDLPVLGSSVLDFTALPLIAGQWLWIGGDAAGTAFATAANNGWARIRSIAAHAISLDKTSGEMVTDAGTGKTVQLFWGKVLRNEADPSLQVRRTYSMERTLGIPDLNAPTKPQAEYVQGAVANEMTVNMTTAEKVTLDMTFLATDYMTIDENGTILSSVGGASAPAINSEDAFNTTSHTVRAKMSILSDTDSAPSTLFAEITEFKFTVKNNLKANKALGKLGPFEITAGFFEGSGSVQAYFNQVAAVQAVRDNADVSIDFALAKNNQGVLFDLRLLTLQSKGLDVKINEPIMLPIEIKMGADRNFNDTVFMEFFSYLPELAMPA